MVNLLINTPWSVDLMIRLHILCNLMFFTKAAFIVIRLILAYQNLIMAMVVRLSLNLFIMHVNIIIVPNKNRSIDRWTKF